MMSTGFGKGKCIDPIVLGMGYKSMERIYKFYDKDNDLIDEEEEEEEQQESL